MDETLISVENFQRAFELPVADKPTLPELENIDWASMEIFAKELNVLSKKMIQKAEDCKQQGREGSALLFMRMHLCTEELGELAMAFADYDRIAVLDALADMRYVADGTALSLGFHKIFLQAFREIHGSNMSKLDDNGKPVCTTAGRVVKGPNYRKPDLSPILAAGSTGI